MGMNYYLRSKSIKCPKTYYEDNELWDFWHSLDTHKTIEELKNGYVFDNMYYPTLEEAEANFYSILHIGKSSYGWHFSLCAYRELGIETLDDWKKLFDDSNNVIIDECGDIISKEEMLSTITERKLRNPLSTPEEEQEYIDKLNNNPMFNRKYRDYDEYLCDNNATRGYNGLLRHGHSMDTGGTWDMTYNPNFS